MIRKTSNTLTKKQQDFVINIVAGDNLSDAYRKAFNKTNKIATVNRKASELFRSPEIQEYYAEVKSRAIEKASIKLSWDKLQAETELLSLLETCKNNLYASDKEGNTILNHNVVNSAVNAIKELNKLQDFYNEKNNYISHQNVLNDANIQDIEKALEERGINVKAIELK